MAQLSFTTSIFLLIDLVKKNFLILHIPLVLCMCTTAISNYKHTNNNHKQGHMLVDQLNKGQITLSDFQHELIKLNKKTAQKIPFGLSVVGLVLFQFLLYVTIVITTFLIALAYFNNTAFAFPSALIITRMGAVLFIYFLWCVSIFVPLAGTLTLATSLVTLTPLTFIIALIGAITSGLTLFLMVCFCCTLPILLEDEQEIVKSMRKSYRLCKHNFFTIVASFLLIFVITTVAFHLPLLLIKTIIPKKIYLFLKIYGTMWIKVISILTFPIFYAQLSGKELLN